MIINDVKLARTIEVLLSNEAQINAQLSVLRKEIEDRQAELSAKTVMAAAMFNQRAALQNVGKMTEDSKDDEDGGDDPTGKNGGGPVIDMTEDEIALANQIKGDAKPERIKPL